MKHWLLPGSFSCWLITTGIGQHTRSTYNVSNRTRGERFNEPTVVSRSAMITKLPDPVYMYLYIYIYCYVCCMSKQPMMSGHFHDIYYNSMFYISYLCSYKTQHQSISYNGEFKAFCAINFYKRRLVSFVPIPAPPPPPPTKKKKREKKEEIPELTKYKKY